VFRLGALLDAHPDRLTARDKPYEWTLLHGAAQLGNLAAVELLLERGLDVNAREVGDNTYAMHWAAAAGHVDVVRRLIDAGGDVVGSGDDHQLAVIGWASCWNDCDDDAHRAVVDLLLRHGARHHIYSAIALDLADEVRRIVRDDPSALTTRMSRNESNQTPLHFAVRMNRPAMAALLIELGADPLAVDANGLSVAAYVTAPGSDRPVMEAIHALTLAEMQSADRGRRPSHGSSMDLIASLSLGDLATAERLVRDSPELVSRAGALHLAARRDDLQALSWLLDNGADPDARWTHGNTEMTALHLAAWYGHADVVRTLLQADADSTIRDAEHHSDPRGWAEFNRQEDIVRLFDAHTSST
jgi:ankyrin repeat protein